MESRNNNMNIYQGTQRSAFNFRQQVEYTFEKPLAVLNFLLLFFSFFLLFTSNPFLKISIPCIISIAELNPILQDPVLAIHPPCIYAGYVASAIAFTLCFSVPTLSFIGYPSLLLDKKYRIFSKNKKKSSLIGKWLRLSASKERLHGKKQ